MTYQDRLQSEFDEITAGIDGLLERAATESRDLTDDENAQIERDDARRGQLEEAIGHYAARAERTGRVAQLRSRVPSLPQHRATTPPEADPVAELLRDMPTPGHYASVLHRAWVKKDPAAIAMIERATAHQMLADNPGVVPKPIVAPVIDRMVTMRPLVQSVGVHPAPAPKFDRPVVVQHVAVGAQVLEKDLTASQKMLINPVEVVLQTHAGHLNLSRQDIRWSQPSILGLVYDDFAKMYARVSDKAACSTFVTKVTATQEIAGAPGTYTPSAIDAALGAVATTIGGADGDNGELNHLWLSRDVAVALASLRNANTGAKVYNIPLVNGTSGDLDGIPVTIDPRFAAATFIAGDDGLVEFWEDLEGFLTVDEPDVLGQLVGYAGYNALSVLDPTGFVKLTNIAALGEAAEPEAAPAGKK